MLPYLVKNIETPRNLASEGFRLAIIVSRAISLLVLYHTHLVFVKRHNTRLFFLKIFHYRPIYAIIYLIYRLWQKEVKIMEPLFTIATAVLGNIISYYIIKWLDDRKR